MSTDKKNFVWDVINSINEKNRYMEINEENEAEYAKSRYTIERFFSMFSDTTLLANELNKISRNINNREHYDFLYYAVPKRKRFSKWAKKVVDKRVSDLSQSLQISEHKMKDIISVLNTEEIDHLIKELEKGGNK